MTGAAGFVCRVALLSIDLEAAQELTPLMPVAGVANVNVPTHLGLIPDALIDGQPHLIHKGCHPLCVMLVYKLEVSSLTRAVLRAGAATECPVHIGCPVA